MIQGTEKDEKSLADLNHCSGTCSRIGKLSVQGVHLASVEERKICFGATAQICFMTKFSQS